MSLLFQDIAPAATDNPRYRVRWIRTVRAIFFSAHPSCRRCSRCARQIEVRFQHCCRTALLRSRVDGDNCVTTKDLDSCTWLEDPTTVWGVQKERLLAVRHSWVTLSPAPWWQTHWWVAGTLVSPPRTPCRMRCLWFERGFYTRFRTSPLIGL